MAGPFGPGNYRNRVFSAAAETAGLGVVVKDAEGCKHYQGITPHDLRDTAATLALSSGATVP
jgi:integrase